MQIPSNLPLQGPSPASAPPRAEEASAWPFSHATQYIPGDQGGVQPVLKIPFSASETTLGGVPQTFEDNRGVRHHALISPDRTRLRVFQPSGKLDFCFSSPDYVQQVEYQPASDTYYVRSNQAIHALKDGQEIATISPENTNCLGQMKVLSTGDLTLIQPLDTFWNGSVITLSPELGVRWQKNIDIATNQVLDVGNGHVAVFKDGDDLAVLNASGDEVLRSKNPALYSPIVHDGRLMFLESHPSKYDRKWKEVVSYDSRSGKVRRTRVSAEADRIVPLPEGRFMLEDGGAGHPHLTVYDKEGKKAKSFKFPDDRYARQLHVARDGKTALLVLGDTRSDLYRLDLQPSESPWYVVGLGTSDRPEPIFQRQGGFTPALLSNGQLAIFHAEGIELNGRRLGSTSEFLQAVGPGVELATDQVPMSYISVNERTRQAGPLDKLLCDVQADFKLASARVKEPGTGPYLTPDHCLNFPLPALGAMPVAGHLTAVDTARVLRSLFRSEATTMQAFGDWKLELQSDRIQLTDSEGNAKAAFGSYTAVLPVRLGEHKFVAAVGDGNLVWLKPRKHDFESETYSLGEPISGLELSPDGRSVVASTVGGSRLDFSPPNFGSGLQDASAPPPAPEAPVGLRETVSTVQVGGVIIRKKR